MKTKLPFTDLATQDAIFYTGLMLLLLIVFLVSFFIFLIYNTLQNEKKRKQCKYTPTIKKVDKVYTTVMSRRMYIIKKIFKWLIVLPIIYLIGIISVFLFGIVLVISNNTKWIWPGKLLVTLSNFYRFLSTIENW